MKIVILDGETLNPGDISWHAFNKFGDVTIYDRTPDKLTIQRIGDAEIVFTNKTRITPKVLDNCPSIKFIGVLATGYNVVDIKAAQEKSVTVCNIPNYGTMAVAQYTTALLLELCHHIGEHSSDVRSGGWCNRPDFCYWHSPLIELMGKKLGLIGYGRIGSAFANIAQALGMKVLAYTPSGKSTEAHAKVKFVSLDKLLAESDVISLHCPLTIDNAGLINRHTIAKMKDGVMLLNTARGGLVVENELAEALNNGKVSGAALDVLAAEPPPANNPLLNARNCIITPHIAWAPTEARIRLMNIAVENLEKFLSGNPQNVVS
ncbi:D-2-hydroxyacid dehydrogenase [Budvicia diplopodorum]|uniref:D-2-hydroxyacid dehydrogenase n=1 Tax=Budvicia diplopodorum TaxID=1119056 RepID=UPI00135C4126|nr:D-2-hydroxyacid dehydrogenase [Budvicia diplopodorum]